MQNVETESPTGGAWDKIMSYVVVAWKFFRLFTNPVSGGFALLTLAFTIFSNAKALWVDMFTKMDQIAAGSIGSVDFQPLGFANYLLPLDELLTHLVGWAGVWVLCNIVRIIKSFIPTVS